jgi:5-methylthioadenosine/S-adenosylhomocysteine deaminase
MAYPYEGWLVRNVEYETFKTGKKSVYQSALPLKNAAEYRKNRKRMEDGSAFIYHLSEGTEPVLLEEYELARQRRILRPRFCGIHCTALGAPQFEEWEGIAEEIDGQEDVEGEENGTIVWSPFSNLWLYRATTDVVAARGKGVRICLGSEWSPSGSKNLLGELKVADLWNRRHMDRGSRPRSCARWPRATPPTRSAGQSGSAACERASTATCWSRPTAGLTRIAT